MIAIVTGMSSQYLGSEVFGSWKDYVTLFLWAAALDTGKNVLQVLGGSTSTASSGGSASRPTTPPATPAASGSAKS